MIALPPQIRVFLYRLPTDMRKSFHGLVALTESALMQDPLSGSLFVFVNRRRDRIKILYWGQTGFCIWYQQLQKGTYQLPDEASLEERQAVEVTPFSVVADPGRDRTLFGAPAHAFSVAERAVQARRTDCLLTHCQLAGRGSTRVRPGMFSRSHFFLNTGLRDSFLFA